MALLLFSRQQEEHHWYDLGDASRRFLLKLAGAAAAATLLTCAPSASPAHAEVQVDEQLDASLSPVQQKQDLIIWIPLVITDCGAISADTACQATSTARGQQGTHLDSVCGRRSGAVCYNSRG
jgi:hypothetical protein